MLLRKPQGWLMPFLTNHDQFMEHTLQKTALFFGSFDPVHIGHLIIAEYFLNKEEIDEVWFVITPQNPFKADQNLTDQNLRKEMLARALEDVKQFRLCDIEFDMPPPNYTYKTLLRLKQEYPSRQFALMIGGDNLQAFDKWKNYDEILQMLPVYVYPRVGYESHAFDHYPNLHKTTAPVIEVSSTDIRKNLAGGLSARFLLPQRVYDFIIEKGIYTNPNAFFNAST